MTDNIFLHMQRAAEDWARAASPWLEAVTPTLPSDVLETFFGKGFNPEGLDAKTRLLLTLAGLTVSGGIAEPQIRITVRQALEAGATEQEIAETIAQMSMFGGVPAMTKALTLAQEVIAERRQRDAE